MHPTQLPDWMVRFGLRLANDEMWAETWRKWHESSSQFGGRMRFNLNDPNAPVDLQGEQDDPVIQEIVPFLAGSAVWVNPDMDDAIKVWADSLPDDFTLHPSDIFTTAGYVRLERPIITLDRNSQPIVVVGWSWSMVLLDMRVDLAKMREGGLPLPEPLMTAIPGFGPVPIPPNEQVPILSATFYSDPSDPRDSMHEEWKAMPGRIKALLPFPFHSVYWPLGTGISDKAFEPLPGHKGTVDLLRFMAALYKLAGTRIVEEVQPTNRAERRRLERCDPNKRLKIIRLRRVSRTGSGHDDSDEYRIGYRYIVPPHWQRYHTKEGVIWKAKDAYVAGNPEGPLLDREKIYTIDR